jgi:hypothetical protein
MAALVTVLALAGCESPPRARSHDEEALAKLAAQKAIRLAEKQAMERKVLAVAMARCDPFDLRVNPAARWARVRPDAPAPLPLWYGREGCPEAGEACRSEIVLQSGDVVFLGRTRDEWACVAKGMDHATPLGYVAMRHLEAFPETPTDSDGWTGEWSSFAHEIDPREFDMLTTRTLRFVAGEDGKLVAAVDSFRAPVPGDPHGPGLPPFRYGGVVRADGSITAPSADPFPDRACVSRFVRHGDVLAMQTNGNCGGLGMGSLFTRVPTRSP